MKAVFHNGLTRFKRIVRSLRLKIFLAVFLFIVLLIEGTGYFLGGWKQPQTAIAGNLENISSKQLEQLHSKNTNLKKRLAGKLPKNSYIIIDTARNKLMLKNREDVLLEAVISAGSGNILDDPNGNKQWVFDTPRGEFHINSKLVTPVWKKPDWAFIEEGESIPLREKDRMENGALGNYAMGFGGGFFIHGTLYTRLLGRNVTHGCIRVGDDQLKALYQTVSIGTHVYIF